jgi:hypothetical protein
VRVDRELDELHRGRVGGHRQLARRGRDPLGELQVAPAQAADVVTDQADRDAGVPQVEVRVVVGLLGHLPDRVDEGQALRERSGVEVCERPGEQHPPILDARRLVELTRRDPVGHALNIAERRSPGRGSAGSGREAAALASEVRPKPQ